MSAKYTLRLGNDKHVKIPIKLDFSSMDQSEVVNGDFVDIEVDKAINPIVDYEKVRFNPLTTLVSGAIKNLTYKVNLLDESGSPYPNTTYGDIGFVDDDIRFNKNRFLNTFLRLNFFDSDVLTNQNLISQVTIFSKITEGDIRPLKDFNTGEILDGGGLPYPVNELPVRFVLNNPITNPRGFAEGYYLYHFKSELIKNGAPKALYMRAEFNNANNGISTKLMSSDRLDMTVDELVKNLHTRYLLTRTETGYYYRIDPTYKMVGGVNNVTENGTDVTVNLYEVKAI